MAYRWFWVKLMRCVELLAGLQSLPHSAGEYVSMLLPLLLATLVAHHMASPQATQCGSWLLFLQDHLTA